MPRLTVLAFALLTACVSSPAPSRGDMELLVSGMTKAKAMEILLANATSNGWTVEHTDESSLVVAQKRVDPVSVLASGADSQGASYTRMAYTVVEEGSNVHVFARAYQVASYGTASERAWDPKDRWLGPREQEQMFALFFRGCSRGHTIAEELSGVF